MTQWVYWCLSSLTLDHSRDALTKISQNQFLRCPLMANSLRSLYFEIISARRRPCYCLVFGISQYNNYEEFASLREHALKSRRASWKSIICFRVVDHDMGQNRRKTLSMVFDFLLFTARRVHLSGHMAGYESCPHPGSGPPLIHYTTFEVPR